MEKVFIKNRNDKKICVVVEQPEEQPKGLAFVMHGFGGFKEQLHIQAIAETFLSNKYITVRFDTTHAFGESEGSYEDATQTGYYFDLVDVINWSKSQSWYSEPFCFAGHSCGGYCTALFAENFPKIIKAVAPISTVVTGPLTIEAYKATYGLEKYNEWEQTGWQVSESSSIPGLEKKLKWHPYIEDLVTNDLLLLSDKLTMSVLLIVGSEDTITPLSDQKLLFKKIPGKKELHVINGALHTFRETQHIKELKEIFDKWIKSLN